MKTIKPLIILTVVSLFINCGQTAEETSIGTNKSKSVHQKNELNKWSSKEERREQIGEQRGIDSLRLDFALRDAFKTAKNQFQNDNFFMEYDIQPDDSSFTVHLEIEIGDIFKNGSKYFLLRRHTPGATYLNIYRVNGGQVEKVLTRKQAGMSYVGDTIFDVNGDEINDFLVHWYPSSGCCRRNTYSVYLNKPSGMFTSDYEFINPTFSANEKIIRGVGYGHPGEVELYKYKWNGYQIDTIEFIYPEVSKVGQYIKTKKREYYPTTESGQLLKGLPKEYSNISSINWFLSYKKRSVN